MRPTWGLWLVSLCLSIWALSGCGAGKFAENTSAALSGEQPLTDSVAAADTFFNDALVNPLSLVMFYDLVFWDNHLAPVAAVGKTFDGQRIIEHGDAGFVRRAEHTLSDPAPAYPHPTEVALGTLKVQVQSADGGYTVSVPAQAVDLAALGLTALDAEPAEEEPESATVTTLAPFPVQVDRRTAMTLPTEASVARSALPALAVGQMVALPEGSGTAIVESLGGSGEVVALATTSTTSTDAIPNPTDINIPVVVAWLAFGALFFTLRMVFVNVRLFGHALVVTAGKYDHPDDPGEISHFQALSSALSATVGLGNIAGVAIAVSAGGPGAIFWMVVAGLLGMSSKFVEVTLGQMYRVTLPDGSVSGGPMHYLDKGLAGLGMPGFGKVLAVVFAVMCIGGSLGGGNMFQANQSNAALVQVLIDWGAISAGSANLVSVVYGLTLAFVVGLVILGGIKRIGSAAGVIVPLMVGTYMVAGLFILVVNAAAVPDAMMAIIQQAFTPEAGFGGLLGVLIQGFRRAAFSNEAGVGSASIAHSAATTNYPVREGIVALLEPFIDTVVVCTMTGLVVVVTGAYQTNAGDGVVMTQAAFATAHAAFPAVLSFAVILFAFSTMVSWSYYGERCAVWLLGDSAKVPYRALFLVCVFLGANFNLGSVLNFSDLMILGMAFPNILGALFLAKQVKTALDEYIAKLKAGEFKTT